jgi:hypothetical protein
VKGVQQERRHALTLPSLDLDARLVERILELVREGYALASPADGVQYLALLMGGR